MNEKSILFTILNLMDAAAREAPEGDTLSEAVLIASGWPARIAPVAAEALALFRSRGLFSEDAEEFEPGISI